VVETEINKFGFINLRVNIRKNNSFKMTECSYKLDTGASSTTIDIETLEILGFDEKWIVCNGVKLKDEEAPTLADGTPVKNCYRVVLPEISIGDWVGYNWPILVSLNTSFRLLLGVDSLQFFNWTINYERSVCRFNLILNKRKLVFNGKEQSVHSLED